MGRPVGSCWLLLSSAACWFLLHCAVQCSAVACCCAVLCLLCACAAPCGAAPRRTAPHPHLQHVGQPELAADGSSLLVQGIKLEERDGNVSGVQGALALSQVELQLALRRRGGDEKAQPASSRAAGRWAGGSACGESQMGWPQVGVGRALGRCGVIGVGSAAGCTVCACRKGWLPRRRGSCGGSAAPPGGSIGTRRRELLARPQPPPIAHLVKGPVFLTCPGVQRVKSETVRLIVPVSEKPKGSASSTRLRSSCFNCAWVDLAAARGRQASTASSATAIASALAGAPRLPVSCISCLFGARAQRRPPPGHPSSPRLKVSAAVGAGKPPSNAQTDVKCGWGAQGAGTRAVGAWASEERRRRRRPARQRRWEGSQEMPRCNSKRVFTGRTNWTHSPSALLCRSAQRRRCLTVRHHRPLHGC